MKKRIDIISVIIIVILTIGLTSTVTLLIVSHLEPKNNAVENNNDGDNIEDDVIKDVIYLEGMEEIIYTKVFNSSLGYKLRYDKDIFKVKKDNNLDVFYSSDVTYVTVEKSLETFDELTKDIKIDEDFNYDINNFKTIHNYEAKDNVKIHTAYMDTAKGVYIIRIYYPSGDTGYIEGFASRAIQMFNTFELTN